MIFECYVWIIYFQLTYYNYICFAGRIHVWDLRTFHSKKGYATLSHTLDKGQTIWGGVFLPQNREVFATLGGSGTLGLFKYEYPEKRVQTLDNDEKIGVVGKVTKLQESTLGDQPISGFDWSRDKTGLGVCTGFDQKIRLVITTKLNTLWRVFLKGCYTFGKNFSHFTRWIHLK